MDVEINQLGQEAEYWDFEIFQMVLEWKDPLLGVYFVTKINLSTL